MTKPSLTVTEDRTDAFNKMIKSFKNDEVLIGIPATDGTRKSEKDGSINNATILAINEFGSPANNIPPRPVMSIGIVGAQDAIAEEFKKAAKSALTNPSAWSIYLQRAGIIASTSVKKAINVQEGFDGPSKATLAARKAMGFAGKKALIVTGQLRNAITYVVKGNKQFDPRPEEGEGVGE